MLLPLDESVGFNAMLQKGNHIQVPKLIRWHYKIEPDQILKIGISFKGGYGSEKFVACMSKDGRITIPELAIQLLKQEIDETDSLLNSASEITLGPLKTQQRQRHEPVLLKHARLSKIRF